MSHGKLSKAERSKSVKQYIEYQGYHSLSEGLKDYMSSSDMCAVIPNE